MKIKALDGSDTNRAATHPAVDRFCVRKQNRPYWLYLLALVLGPLMTGVPAFVAGFVGAKVLALVSPHASGH